MEIKITVDKYISEAKDQILDLCSQTVDACDKMHIKAPVGSGKTTMILELIQRYPDKRFIVLFPQISITEQVKVKLTALNIESSLINSESIEKVIKENTVTPSGTTVKVFLTTIDSAYKLIEEVGFSKDDTIVIVDETHTFLTSSRDNHTRSVETILKGGFSIIGFSATPSTWVNRMLFGIENLIDITTRKVKQPVISRTTVEHGGIRTLANIIAKENKALTVVFTEYKKTQNELKLRINEYNPNIKVSCLNADTKASIEEDTWDHLMTTDELLPEYNVFILNSVVQSGINIKNTKIDNVYLFGTFDPFGFVQYLGRCRNYKKQFRYYHTPYSKQIGIWGGVNEIQNWIDAITRFLNATDKEFHEEIKSMMGDTLYEDKNQNLVANKCLIATKIFDKLRDLSGETLTHAVSSFFKDIEFKRLKTIEGEVVTSATSKAKSRATGKSDLIEFVMDEYPLIIEVFKEIGYDYSQTNLVKTIDTKYGGKLAKLPAFKQQYDKLNHMIELMKEAQMMPHRLSTAAYLYYNSKKSELVLKEYINMKNGTAIGISEAIKFFGSFKKSNPTIKKALKELQDYIGDTNNATDWKNIVNRLLPGLNSSKLFTDNFYKFCLQTKSSNSKLKLVRINTSLNNYIEGLGLEHITVVNDKIAPK